MLKAVPKSSICESELTQAYFNPTGVTEAHYSITQKLISAGPHLLDALLTPRPVREFPAEVTLGDVEQIDSLRMDIVRARVALRNLHPCMEGTKILFLADTHLDESNKKPIDRLNNGYDLLCGKGERPDFIVFGGDFVDRNFSEIKPFEEFIKRTKYRVPFYYVLGNHDNKDGQRQEIITRLNKAGAHNLTNNDRKITKGGGDNRNAPGIYLMGLDDLHTGNISVPDLERRSDCPRILVLHNLDGLPKHVIHYLDFVLAAHTHQNADLKIRLPGNREITGQDLVAGIPTGYKNVYDIEDWGYVGKNEHNNLVPAYISAGLSTSPLRHQPCSMALLTLIKGESLQRF